MNMNQRIKQAVVQARAIWQNDRRMVIRLECELEGFIVRANARDEQGAIVTEVNQIVPFNVMVGDGQCPLLHAVNLAREEMHRVLHGVKDETTEVPTDKTQVN